jgi:hypothetical protein
MGCNALTIGYTRTLNSPLRTEFSACEPRRSAARNNQAAKTYAKAYKL